MTFKTPAFRRLTVRVPLALSRWLRTSRGAIWIVAFACAFATLGPSRVARACTMPAPDPILSGMPADGDRGVPTDVVPYYQVGFSSSDGTVPGAFSLTSASGTPIALTAKEADYWSFELIPAHAL